MSLLSYDDLLLLALREDEGGRSVITNVLPDSINSTSIDIHLGQYVMVEQRTTKDNFIVSLRDRTPLSMRRHDLKQAPLELYPDEFVLAQSIEMFNLPDDISAEYKLKSSMARIGLEHLNAGWCDAGWHGSVLTLELKNMTKHHGIRLHYGDAIGQMVFYRHAPVPADRSYAARGRYNNDRTVSGIKE